MLLLFFFFLFFYGFKCSRTKNVPKQTKMFTYKICSKSNKKCYERKRKCSRIKILWPCITNRSNVVTSLVGPIVILDDRDDLMVLNDLLVLNDLMVLNGLLIVLDGLLMVFDVLLIVFWLDLYLFLAIVDPNWFGLVKFEN